MKTHFEPSGEFTVKEIIDERNIFECDKGHKWEETLENRYDVPLPISFGSCDNICPFCLGEFLATLGKVTIK